MTIAERRPGAPVILRARGPVSQAISADGCTFHCLEFKPSQLGGAASFSKIVRFADSAAWALECRS